MSKFIQPLDDKVLIQRSDAASKTPGGLHLPDSAKEKPKTGFVKAVGPGKLLDSGERGKVQVKVGDEVIFTSYSGHEIELNNEEFMLMSESDILGIIKEK